MDTTVPSSIFLIFLVYTIFALCAILFLTYQILAFIKFVKRNAVDSLMEQRKSNDTCNNDEIPNVWTDSSPEQGNQRNLP